MEKELPYKHMQTIVSIDEYNEIMDYMVRNNISSRREWIKTIILKEVRSGNDTKPLPLH